MTVTLRRRHLLASSLVASLLIAVGAAAAACGFYAAEESAPVVAPPRDAAPDALPLGPKCPGAGLSCIPLAPEGWSGPFVLYDGNPANAPACPDAMPAVALEGNRDVTTTDPHTCTACACESPTDVKCDTATFTTWATPDCTGANISPKSITTACQSTPSTYPGSHSIVGVPSGGGCDPKQAIVADKPPAKFAYATRACGADLVSDGCNADFVCVADPLPPFNAKHCITQPGDTTCPGAPYNVKTTTFAKVEDSRTCRTCECSNPTNVQCTGSVQGYSDAGCTGTTTTKPYPSGCAPGLPSYASLKVVAGKPDGGSCAPSGGAPIGAIKLTDIVTICCAQ